MTTFPFPSAADIRAEYDLPGDDTPMGQASRAASEWLRTGLVLRADLRRATAQRLEMATDSEAPLDISDAADRLARLDTAVDARRNQPSVLRSLVRGLRTAEALAALDAATEAQAAEPTPHGAYAVADAQLAARVAQL